MPNKYDPRLFVFFACCIGMAACILYAIIWGQP